MDSNPSEEQFYTLKSEITADHDSNEEESFLVTEDGDFIMETEITVSEDDTNKKKYDELIGNFTKWRDETIKLFENKCKNLPPTSNLKNLQEFMNVVNLPKCIVRLSWEICECEPQCARNLTKGVSYDKACEHFNLEGLNENYVRNDCNYLRLKYYDIKNREVPENQFNYKRNPFQIMVYNWFFYGDIPQVMRCVKYEAKSEIDQTDGYIIDGQVKSPLIISSGSELRDKLDKDQFIFYTPSHKYVQRRFYRSLNREYNLNFDQNISNIVNFTKNSTLELEKQENNITSKFKFPGFILCVGILGIIVINIFKKPRLYSIVFCSLICSFFFASLYNHFIN